MISSVQYGKASINFCEDTLTSSVFDCLLMLPDKLFWEILKKSCLKNNLPEKIKAIEDYDYWPKWNSENTTREKYVEPDLFIRFDNFDLIIEAKRWDINQQYIEQWENEFIAYKNKYSQDEKEVFLLAVGGIYDEDNYINNIVDYGTIKVYRCRWFNILETLVDIIDNFNISEYFNYPNIYRIIKLLITSLEIHGLMKINWLDDIKYIHEVNFEENYETINNWRMYKNGLLKINWLDDIKYIYEVNSKDNYKIVNNWRLY
jgi:hypothetical protein